MSDNTPPVTKQVLESTMRKTRKENVAAEPKKNLEVTGSRKNHKCDTIRKDSSKTNEGRTIRSQVLERTTTVTRKERLQQNQRRTSRSHTQLKVFPIQLIKATQKLLLTCIIKLMLRVKVDILREADAALRCMYPA